MYTIAQTLLYETVYSPFRGDQVCENGRAWDKWQISTLFAACFTCFRTACAFQRQFIEWKHLVIESLPLQCWNKRFLTRVNGLSVIGHSKVFIDCMNKNVHCRTTILGIFYQSVWEIRLVAPENMSSLKRWCVHPTRHRDDTRIGLRPSHPEGHHPISAELARNLQEQWGRSIGTTEITLREGDRLCKVCFYTERARFDKLYQNEADSMDCGDEGSVEDLHEASEDSFLSSKGEQLTIKEKLNRILQLLDISPIVDL